MSKETKQFIGWFHVKKGCIFMCAINADEEVAPNLPTLLCPVIERDDIREIIMLEVLSVHFEKGIVSDEDNGNRSRFPLLGANESQKPT